MAEHKIEAGQTWEIAQPWAIDPELQKIGKRFSVIGPHPDPAPVWAVAYQAGGLRWHGNLFILDCCILILDKNGHTVSPPKPAQVNMHIFCDCNGDIQMYLPSKEGIESPAAIRAAQNIGSNGWTCVGFVFAEIPEIVFPMAQGWVDPDDPEPGRVELMRFGKFTKRVIATTAIWEKAHEG